MNEIGQSFIASARGYFAQDYLPKIERCLELLTDEQIWWRANPQSNSIGNLLLHLSGNVRQWIVCNLGGAPDGRDRDSEFAQRGIIPRDELLARLKQTLSEADATLANFDPDRLLERHVIQGLDVTALEAIFHVVEHFSMHAGQVLMLTKQFSQQDIATVADTGLGRSLPQVINYEALNDEATQGQPDDREKGSNKSFEVALEGALEFFEPKSRDNKND